MFGKAQLATRRCEGHAAIVLLVVLVASLIAYKSGPALRAIRTAQSTGQLKPRPYLVSSALSARPGVLWTESSAYFRIIWPALVFGILISAAARVAIRQDWLASAFTGSGLWSTFSGAAAGVPLMLCSCCAAPVFEGMYGRTRRLDTSLALMLAAPALNPAALTLTFILFPLSVATGRLALTAAALVGIAGIATLVSQTTTELCEEPRSRAQRSLLAAYADSVLHVSLRTIPLILVGIPIAILIFNHLQQIHSFGVANSTVMLVLFLSAVLLLPMPTLFEIPLAYSLLLSGAPSGLVAAVLFIGPAVNLPSLLVVARAAGVKTSLLLALLIGGLAIATGLAFSR
jgi:uncharacterized membrane protein YraQ (UPF0718 family)